MCLDRRKLQSFGMHCLEIGATSLKNNLWDVEAVFHIVGFLNCHYQSNCPIITCKKMQNRPKVAELCGMTFDRIVDPFILRDTINMKSM